MSKALEPKHCLQPQKLLMSGSLTMSFRSGPFPPLWPGVKQASKQTKNPKHTQSLFFLRTALQEFPNTTLKEKRKQRKLALGCTRESGALEFRHVYEGLSGYEHKLTSAEFLTGEKENSLGLYFHTRYSSLGKLVGGKHNPGNRPHRGSSLWEGGI